MIIDCHAHLVPPTLLDAIRAAKANFPSVKLIEEGGSLGFAFAGSKPTRPVSKPLSDIAARLQWLDTNKIERQVVGGWLDMFAYEVPAEEGAKWSRLINTHLAQTAKSEPRFVPLATVPLQDGARAAEVLREAHTAGFKGAIDIKKETPKATPKADTAKGEPAKAFAASAGAHDSSHSPHSLHAEKKY